MSLAFIATPDVFPAVLPPTHGTTSADFTAKFSMDQLSLMAFQLTQRQGCPTFECGVLSAALLSQICFDGAALPRLFCRAYDSIFALEFVSDAQGNLQTTTAFRAGGDYRLYTSG